MTDDGWLISGNLRQIYLQNINNNDGWQIIASDNDGWGGKNRGKLAKGYEIKSTSNRDTMEHEGRQEHEGRDGTRWHTKEDTNDAMKHEGRDRDIKRGHLKGEFKQQQKKHKKAI